jgi:lipoprotein-releasing system ATP-binding protein
MAIILKDVIKSFSKPPIPIIKNINLKIDNGEFVSLTGKSGSGKSTLLYLISSLDMPTSGSIEIDGNDLSKMNSNEVHSFRNRNMGFIFQFHYLLPEFTSLENVLMPARKAGILKEKRKFAEELFEKFDLKEKMHEPPGRLSGGQLQRVAIARSMIMSPAYIFADEPTGSLDSSNGRKVMEIFKTINNEEKTTIVLVTHDNEFANYASRKITLLDGVVV